MLQMSNMMRGLNPQNSFPAPGLPSSAQREVSGGAGRWGVDSSSVLRFARSSLSRVGRRGAFAAATVFASTAVAAAQTATPVPNVTTGQSQATFGQNGATTIKRLLADGYEIKTGFVDPNGGAYLALQKATSAYFCHSNPNPTCEKLN